MKSNYIGMLLMSGASAAFLTSCGHSDHNNSPATAKGAGFIQSFQIISSAPAFGGATPAGAAGPVRSGPASLPRGHHRSPRTCPAQGHRTGQTADDPRSPRHILHQTGRASRWPGITRTGAFPDASAGSGARSRARSGAHSGANTDARSGDGVENARSTRAARRGRSRCRLLRRRSAAAMVAVVMRLAGLLRGGSLCRRR